MSRTRLSLLGPIGALTLASVFSGCLVEPVGAPPSEPAGSPDTGETQQALSCGGDMPAVELGDLTMPFVPAAGIASPNVTTLGLGLGAGTLAVTPGGIRLSLRAAQGGPKGVAAATVLVQHVGGSPAFKIDPSSLLSSTSTFVTTAGTTSGVANYGSLVASKLYPGIRAQVSGTTRMLTTTYTIQPGASASSIALSFGSAASVTVDKIVGSVAISVAAGARALSLGPPEAYQLVNGAKTAVSASYSVVSGTVKIALGSTLPNLPVYVTTKLLHSPHFAASGTRETGGVTLASGATSRATQVAADTRDDAYLAVLDSATGTLSSTTFFVGDGDDEAIDCAETASGELLLAGVTTSKALPILGGLQSTSAGGRDGFVARLSPSGTALLASTYLGGAGQDSVTGVTEDATGAIVVIGTSTSPVAPQNIQAADFVSLLPTKGFTATSQTYALAYLSAGLDTLTTVVPVSGPVISRPRVYQNCGGVISVGVPAIATSIDCTTWPDLTYTMGQYGQNYAQDQDLLSTDPNLGSPPGGYGYHALRWRFFSANDPLSLYPVPGGVTLDWSAAFPNIPKYTPAFGDAAILNTDETLVFSPVDPPGGWAEGWAPTVEYLAMTAAFGEWALGTPVYATYTGHDNNTHLPELYPLAVERTTWDVCVNTSGSTYAGEGLDQLCSFSTSWIGSTACAGNVYASGFSVMISSMEMTHFGPILAHFAEHQIDNPYPSNWWQQWFNPSVWVADPPDDEPQWVAKADEIASRLSGLVVTDMLADQTTFTGGTPTSVQQVTATVRARDTH